MSLARAFFTVGGLTMASRVLGLVREILIAAMLGAGPVAEAFFVAFRFPNLFRRFFAEGAFNMAFVPLFAKRLEGAGPDEGEAGARRFAEEAQAGLLAVLLPLVIGLQVAMPWAILAIAYGFADDPAKLELATAFSVIAFPYLIFISLTALYSGVLNSVGRFAAAAGAPILLNLAMILAMGGAWLLTGGQDDAASQATVGYWLVWSVFAAGVAQLALVIRDAARAGHRLKLRRPRWTPGMRRLVRLGAPGALAGGVTQVNILIGTTIATFFDGAVAWLTYADRLYQLPLGVIGVAIGVALLPELSRRLRAGDGEGARRSATRAVALGVGFALPAGVALIVMPEAIVRMLFERGAFDASDVADTALATQLYALGLPAYVLIKCLSPAYFAEEDTRAPLRYAAWSMAVNTAVSAGAAPVIGWIAVPIGTALAAWVNVVMLWRGLGDRAARPELGPLTRRLIGIVLASAAMGAGLFAGAEYGAVWIADPLWRYPAVLGLCLAGCVLYLIAVRVLGGVTRADIAALRRGRSGAAAA